MSKEVTATLRDPLIVDSYGVIVASGKVYRDTRGRFADGEDVTTTCILSFDVAAQTITTKNSVYKLEPWPDLLRCPHCYGVFGKAGDAGPVKGLSDFGDIANDEEEDDPSKDDGVKE